MPCRPRLPNFQATLQFVRDYICSLNGGGVLNKPLFQPNVVPTLTFAAVDELSVVEVQQLQCSNEENPQREAKRWWIIQLCVQLVNLRSFFLTLVSSTRHQCLGLDDSGRRLRKPRVKNWIINSYWGMIIHP